VKTFFFSVVILLISFNIAAVGGKKQIGIDICIVRDGPGRISSVHWTV